MAWAGPMLLIWLAAARGETDWVRAVCDEAVVSKPPSLEGIRATKEPEALEAQVELSEAKSIAFLLGSPEAVLGSPYLLSQLRQAKPRPLRELRRALSLETCTALASPEKMARFFERRPSPLIQAGAWGGAGPTKSHLEVKPWIRSGHALVRVRDPRSRFGQLRANWWIGGWIEPDEVLLLRYGTREYRRAGARAAVVLGRDAQPIGGLAAAGAQAPGLFEAYLARVDGEGAARPELRDYYRHLIEAYRDSPEDPQFAQYARKAGRLMGEGEVRLRLDGAFRASVAAAGARFVAYGSDARLQGMLNELGERLSRSE